MYSYHFNDVLTNDLTEFNIYIKIYLYFQKAALYFLSNQHITNTYLADEG